MIEPSIAARTNRPTGAEDALGQGSGSSREGSISGVAYPGVHCKMAAGALKPAGEPEVVVKDLLPDSPQHNDKGLTFDGKGSLYINVGAPSNACQQPDRRAGVKGADPCPILEKAGIKVALEEVIPQGATSAVANLQKVRAEKVDAILQAEIRWVHVSVSLRLQGRGCAAFLGCGS